jgi:hypothetical protein
MKIAVYSDSGLLLSVYENINNPKSVGTDIEFDGGSFSGVTDKHVLISEDSEVPVTLEEAVSLDQKGNLNKVQTLAEENAELRSRLESAEMAIISLMDFM